MRFLIIQENGRHMKNAHLRECYCMQRSIIKLRQVCDIWGMGHENFRSPIDFNAYDVIIDLENYDSGWTPDLSSVNAYKILWSIDAHCQGLEYYINRFNRNKCHLMLQATKEFVRKDCDLWFPNCFDSTIIKPRMVAKRADVGFCGNVVNRQSYFNFLGDKFDFITDIFVIGDDMVNAINSYRIHFNKNIANDVNYRNFETIGCKIPLVTDYNDNYDGLGFKDGENCMFYNNDDELVEKIKVLLDNQVLLNSIAESGYKLSSNHTYDVRARFLVNFLYNKI